MDFNLVLLNASLWKCFLKDFKFSIEFFTELLPAQWDLLSNKWNSASEIQLFTTVGNVFFCWKHQFLNSTLNYQTVTNHPSDANVPCPCFSFHSWHFLTDQFYSWHMGHSKYLIFEKSGLWVALKNYYQQVFLKFSSPRTPGINSNKMFLRLIKTVAKITTS